MYLRNLVLAAVVALAAVMPARAALVFDFILIPNITAAANQTGPALTSLTFPTVGSSLFVQVAMRDTVGSGWNGVSQGPGTLAWNPGPTGGQPQANGLGLGAFFLQMDGNPQGAGGYVQVPSPTNSTNIRLAVSDPLSFGSIANGSNPGGVPPPPFTRFGGLVNSGFDPLFPDPLNQNRISLFNMKLTGTVAGTGTFVIRDATPGSDNATNTGFDNTGSPAVPGVLNGIDPTIFGPSFLTTFALPFTVIGVPEPSSMVLCGMALAGIGYRKLRRKTVVVA